MGLGEGTSWRMGRGGEAKGEGSKSPAAMRGSQGGATAEDGDAGSAKGRQIRSVTTVASDNCSAAPTTPTTPVLKSLSPHKAAD